MIILPGILLFLIFVDRNLCPVRFQPVLCLLLILRGFLNIAVRDNLRFIFRRIRIIT